MSELSGLAEMIQPGRVSHLGRLDGGGFGLWLVAGGGPVATFPDDPDGYAAARELFMRWEPSAPPAYVGGSSHVGAWSGGVLFVVLVVVYLVLHAVRYHDCINSVSIFDWPNACLAT